MIAQWVVALGSAGPFATRLFLAPFLIALVLRLTLHSAPIAGTPIDLVARAAANESSWFVSWWFIGLTGVGSIVELVASKNVDFRQLLHEVDPFLKPIMAALTTYGLLSSTDVALVETMTHTHAGVVTSSLLPIVAAGATAAAAFVRQGVWSLVDRMDPDDTFGLGKMLSWAEEVGVIVLALLLFLLPIALLLLTGAILVGCALIERHFEQKAKKEAQPCARCGAPVHPAANGCGACAAPQAHPRALGLVGTYGASLATDAREQTLRLHAARRCGWCATPLLKRTAHQTCPSCAREPFPTTESASEYEQWVSRRERKVLLVCLVLGLLPVLGVLPAVVYYRLQLVAPFQRYLSHGRSIGTRWLARIASFVLALFQALPVVGVVSLPLMALLNHRLYANAFRAASRRDARTEPSVAMSPSWAARVRARLAGLGVLAPLGTLRRKPVALAASFALCAVVLAASVALARRTPPDTQPARCPSANELVVGTWSWNAFEEELDADGTYRIRLPLRVFRSLTLSSSLIELKGRYVLASDGTLSIALGKSTTRYVAFVDRRDALIYYARSGVVSVHRRRSPAVAMPAGCKANTARLPGSWTASDGAMLTVGSDAASFQLASGPRRAVTDASLFVPATSLPMLVLTDARHDESWKGYLDVHPGRLFRRSSPPGGGR